MSLNDLADKSQTIENILAAMDIISTKRLEGLQYDKTIICKIIDASDRDKGEYVVSDGTTTFRAYSENTRYMSGTSVYVVVPLGDFSKQKLISGKYTDESAKGTYNYIPAAQSFIDMTLNLNTDSSEVSCSTYGGNGGSGSVKIFEAFPQDIGGITQYDRLYVAAEFKSWLKAYENTDARYGIKTTILGQSSLSLEEEAEWNALTPQDITEALETEESAQEFLDRYNVHAFELIFDNSEMFGSSMNYGVYSKQDKIFDISSIKKIMYIKSELYFRGFDDAATSEEEYKNLFLKDFYLSLGFDYTYLEGNEALIAYTLDSTYYGSYPRGAAENLDEQNKKRIQLRYVYYDKVKEKYVAIANMTQLQEALGDVQARIVWTRNDLDGNSDSVSVKNSEIDYMIEYPVPDVFAFDFIPNARLPHEILQASLSFVDQETGQTIEIKSRKLEFINEDETQSSIAADLIKGLSISCDPEGMGGSYYLYGEDGVITSFAEKNKPRYFYANYTSSTDGAQIYDADTITWFIPKQRTMLVFDPTRHATNEDAVNVDDSDYWIISKGNTSLIENDSLESGKTYTSQRFSIANSYGSNLTNNTVRCELTKDGRTFIAEYGVVFGPSGSNGTDYRFVVETNGDIAIDFSKTTDQLELSPKLYDNAGAAIESFDASKVNVSWYENGDDSTASQLSYSIDASSHDIVVVKAAGFNGERKNHILKLEYDISSLNEQKTKQKVSLLVPIIIWHSGREFVLSDYSGADKICYNSYGVKPLFLSTPYEIDTTAALTYSLVGANNKYAPKLSQEKILIPSPMYVSGAEKGYGVAISSGSDLWLYQPLLIIQNVYASAMFNEWGGDLVVDNENNHILAATIAAGRKEANNTFTGVVMGELGDANNSLTDSGLLGFNEGEQSFGLKTDGTAFFGKSGKGRILFDGNKGTITSAEYNTENKYKADGTGIFMDLDDAVLHVGGPAVSFLIDAKGTIPSSSTNGSEAFSIKNSGQKLMSIMAKTEGTTTSITEFLIQSPNINISTTDSNFLRINMLAATIEAINSRTSGGNRTLKIDAGHATHPFNVNNKFKIGWDGSVDATLGRIGGWVITESGLHSELTGQNGQKMIGVFNSNQTMLGSNFNNIRFFIGEVNSSAQFTDPTLNAGAAVQINGQWAVPQLDEDGNPVVNENGEIQYNYVNGPTYVPYSVSSAAFYINENGQMTAYDASLFGATVSKITIQNEFTCTADTARFTGKIYAAGGFYSDNMPKYMRAYASSSEGEISVNLRVNNVGSHTHEFDPVNATIGGSVYTNTPSISYQTLKYKIVSIGNTVERTWN